MPEFKYREYHIGDIVEHVLSGDLGVVTNIDKLNIIHILWCDGVMCRHTLYVFRTVVPAESDDE